MATSTPVEDQRTLGQLFADLSRQVRTLIQQELQLAKTEFSEKAAGMATGAGLIIGGGLLAHGGLLALVAALVLGLIALGLPPWAAALIGGLLVAVVGYLLFRAGLSALKQQSLKPQITIDSMKENAQWLKAQTR